MDPLLQLMRVEQIAKSVKETLHVIDALNWDRTYRNRPDLIPLARRVSAYSSAGIEGATIPSDPRNEPDDSPMGKLSQCALGITSEVEFQLNTFLKTPFKSWARLHSFIESGEERGRPRTDNEVADPLHIGEPLDFRLIEARMANLADLIVNSEAPTLLISAVAHAELATIAPFAKGSQMIARATSRMVIQAHEIDQLQLVMPEYGFYKLGRSKYAKALISYKSGTIEGVSDWIKFHSNAISIATKDRELLLELSTSRG
jgi:hypothetical protein